LEGVISTGIAAANRRGSPSSGLVISSIFVGYAVPIEALESVIGTIDAYAAFDVTDEPVVIYVFRN
jgi:hypothetical protein